MAEPFRHMDNDVALNALRGKLHQCFQGGAFQHVPVEIEPASMRAASEFFPSRGKLRVGMRATEQDRSKRVVFMPVEGKIVHERSHPHNEHLAGAESAPGNANPFFNDVRLERREGRAGGE